MTSEVERQALLTVARAAIVAHVTGGASPAIDERWLSRRGGAFVTLQLGGRLRGCIGCLESDRLLARVTARCAVAACSTDPRFPPVTSSELAQIEIELSILGPLEPIIGPDDIEIGCHGLFVEKGSRRGLLLPQVATEWRWNRETFLAQTCRKAGLPLDGWKKDTLLWRFEAEVFGERQEGRKAEGQEGK
jgi:AmmeMemoRadiSam system protein A